MRKRRFALRVVHWLLLAVCLVLALAIARLFWWDASDGRAARDADRAAGAQRQTRDAAPAGQSPISPAQ